MLKKFDVLGNMNFDGVAGHIEIENIKSIIDGDKAICSFTADGEEKEMTLVKVGGKWLIDFDMGDDEISNNADSNSDADAILEDTLSEDAAETEEINE